MNKYDGSKGPPDIAGMTSLKVDNLTYRTTMDELERYFRKYGEVGDIYIPRDRDTHESRGFAFVRFYEERDADDAMEGMDGKVIDGREIRVAMARYGRPTNQYDPRRAGGNRYRGGGGGGGGRDRSGSSHHRDRDSRNSYRERRRSPRKRRSRSRSHSPRRRSRSRSPSNTKRSSSRSPVRHSESPQKSRSASRSKSRSKSRSRSQSRSRSRSRNE